MVFDLPSLASPFGKSGVRASDFFVLSKKCLTSSLPYAKIMAPKGKRNAKMKVKELKNVLYHKDQIHIADTSIGAKCVFDGTKYDIPSELDERTVEFIASDITKDCKNNTVRTIINVFIS